MSTAKHYTWSTINRVGVQVISFLGNILIARLLSPDDYGLVAMLAIILGISWNLTESGFADSLIRKRDADKTDFGTVLTHNVLVSIVLYSALYFLAPAIAGFFHRHELIDITRLLGLSIIIKALTVTEFTRMRKELQFKKFAIIQLLGTLLSVVTGYIAALQGYGYYALVIQVVSMAAYNAVLIMILNKWVPVFRFNMERYKAMRKFSDNMLISYFTNQIGQNMYSVFIGKYQSGVSLGYFNQATKVNDASFQGLNSIILTTSYPIIAKEKEFEVRQIKYRELTRTFLYIHFFISFFLIATATELIPIVFGEKWASASLYLQMITLSTLFFPLMTINANIVKTENKTEIYRNLTFLRNGLTLAALLVTFQFSMFHILVGLIIARYISVLVDIFYCGKHLDFGFKVQIKMVAEQGLAPTVAATTAYIVSHLFNERITTLLLFGVIYGIAFLGINLLMKNESQRSVFTLIGSILKSKK